MPMEDWYVNQLAEVAEGGPRRQRRHHRANAAAVPVRRAVLRAGHRDDRSRRSVTAWLAAGGWGLLGGAALVLGAAVAWFLPVPTRVVATVMAFGSGVLISALAIDLAQEAADTGGLVATVGGFLGGTAVYAAANALLARRGARHRKRSGAQPPSERVGYRRGQRARRRPRLRPARRRRTAGRRGHHRGGRRCHPHDDRGHDDPGGLRDHPFS